MYTNKPKRVAKKNFNNVLTSPDCKASLKIKFATRNQRQKLAHFVGLQNQNKNMKREQEHERISTDVVGGLTSVKVSTVSARLMKRWVKLEMPLGLSCCMNERENTRYILKKRT